MCSFQYPFNKLQGQAAEYYSRKRVTHQEDSHMTDSTPKKVKDESLAVHTMSRRQYYDEVLCVIENAQSTTIDDDFPQFVLQWVVFYVSN